MIDIIRRCEKIGYFTTYEYELFIEDSKFIFRDIINGNRFSIEYTLKENFDSSVYTKKELKNIAFCIRYARELGFNI